MAYINENYLKLRAGYLFPEIGRRVKAFCDTNPDAAPEVIRCGIGDVTEPLPAAAREAMHSAVDDQGNRESFRGYGPEQGYEFLRHAIAENDYRAHGISISDDEIFVSDATKCDTGNILDIFGPNNRIAVMDPVYPVYVDTNVMAGNTGPPDDSGAFEKLNYMPCTKENSFVPELPGSPVDLIYLCYPNNPTGAVATRDALTRWVEYARDHNSIILFDAAYEAFIRDDAIPHSIYEIPGARECAIEFRSFSKSGGFTGVRCAFTVIPMDAAGKTTEGESRALHPLWLRRSTTKFNGASYIVQRGAEALYSEQGKEQVAGLVTHYMDNARILSEAVSSSGLTVHGGTNSPYLWVENPPGIESWAVFDRLLDEARIVITPGSGFGSAGEGYFRISAFNSRSNAEIAAKRLRALKW